MLSQWLARRLAVQRLIEAVTRNRVLVAVVGRHQPDRLPLRRHRLVRALVVGHVGVFGEREEPGQLRHLLAGGVAERFRQDKPIGLQVQAQPLIRVVLRLLVAPRRKVKHERPVLHRPIACQHVADVAPRAGREGVFEKAKQVRRAAALGQNTPGQPTGKRRSYGCLFLRR